MNYSLFYKHWRFKAARGTNEKEDNDTDDAKDPDARSSNKRTEAGTARPPPSTPGDVAHGSRELFGSCVQDGTQCDLPTPGSCVGLLDQHLRAHTIAAREPGDNSRESSENPLEHDEGPHMVDKHRACAAHVSDGWLKKLQRRHGLKLCRVHGEAASASADDVKRGREELLCLTRNFEKRDTFNMNESAFFYCMVPSTSVSKNSMAGRKNIKKRINVAITTNADGSIKMPLLFVGTARQPRCSKGKIGEELGVQYRRAPKGWMNTQLFQGWLGNFNETMKNEERHVLLLLDNASCHQGHDGLSNVKVHMLPPNTTAHLQPQDAGIIRSFKSRVNNIKNRYYVDQLDVLLEQALSAGKANIESSTDFFQVDILVAMRWAQEACESVTSITVNNCWHHIDILDEGFCELVESMEKMRMSPLSIRLST